MNPIEDFITIQAYEALSDGIIIYSTGSGAHPLYANQAALTLCECDSFEELCAYCHNDYLEFFHPDDYKHHIDTIQLAWKSTDNFEHHVQYRIISKQGNTRLLADSGKVISIPGYSKCYICVLTEVEHQFDLSGESGDILTGLLSLGQFTQFCENLFRTEGNRKDVQLYQIAYFNIRHFKDYNMEMGSKKGDVVIKALGDIISKWSTTKVIARIGGDQFVALTQARDMKERITNVQEEFEFQFGKFGMSLKAGVYPVERYDQDVYVACDLAKLACDSIKTSHQSICIYDDNLSKRIKISNYVLHNLDEAMEKQYIQVYYQPVVRALTGKLCGAEALARWIDPEIGFLSPADFIPVLEDNHMITKLDLYILESICARLKDYEEWGVPMIPISFNLSRIDFVDYDIFDEVEKIVKKYGVSRDLINVEITESMVMGDADIFTREIARFRKGGYQVWMDDFGSGYSSLNILQKYRFDEIKLDMQFLANFNERSKNIIRSIILMAKNLGVQTLAEGVETQEQYEFLRSIGCEKLQGYFFSRPLPAGQFREADIAAPKRIEKRAWTKYYDAIGTSNFITDRAVALAEYDGQNISLLFMNNTFENVLQEIGAKSLEVVNHNMNSPMSAISQQFRDLRESCHVGNGVHEIVYTVRGYYVRLRVECLAEFENYGAFILEIFNLSSNTQQHDKFDYVHREMNGLFDMICRIDLNTEEVEFIRQGEYMDLTESASLAAVKQYAPTLDAARSLIHPRDLAEYNLFIDPYTLRERVEKENKGYITGYFRTKGWNGSFVWKAHTIFYNIETNMAIYCSRVAPLEDGSLKKRLLPEWGLEDYDAGNAGLDRYINKGLLNSQTINIFWKDTERRFAGANEQFLKTYGFQDVSEILGKTDEDMLWHVEEGPFADDEWCVLKEGAILRNRHGRCIIKGVAHDIIASKEPIYDNGKIVGLLGTFLIVDEVSSNGDIPLSANTRDTLTGLMSATALTDLVSKYVESFRLRNENFAVVRITFSEYFRVAQSYGHKIATQMLKAVGELITSEFGVTGSAARLYGGNFVVLAKSARKDRIQALADKIRQTLENTHELAGYPVTLNPTTELYFADEIEDIHAIIGLASGGTAMDIEERKRLEEKLSSYNLQLNTVVDAIPGGIAIHKIMNDGSYEIVYSSAGVARITGRTVTEFMEITAKGSAAGVLESDKAYATNAVYEAVQNNQPVNVSYRLWHKDGYPIWVNMKGRIIGEEDGCPLLLLVFQNISEVNQSFEMALNEALVGVIVNSQENDDILYENESAQKIIDDYFDGDIFALRKEAKAACKSDDTADQYFETVCRNRHFLLHVFNRVWNGHKSKIIYIMDNTAKYAAIAEMINALTQDFLNVFQINTKTGLGQTLKLEGHVTDGMPSDSTVIYSAQDIIERYTRERVHEADRAMFLRELSCEGIEANLQDRDEYSFIYRIQVDGEVHTFQAKVIRKDQENNYILGFLNIDALIHIQTMNTQLKEIVESLPGAMVVVKRDTNGTLSRVYASPRSLEYLREETVYTESGEEILSYVHPDDLEQVRKKLKESTHFQKELVMTYRMLCKDQSIRWVRHESNALPQPDGTCLYYVMYTDITKEKQVELERKASLAERYGEYLNYRFHGEDESHTLAIADFQSSLLSAIAGANVSMHIINLEDRTFMTISCAEHVEKVIGGTRDGQEAVNRILTMLIHPESQKEARQFLDLSTLAARLKGQTVLKSDFRGLVSGWERGQFIPVSLDQNGQPKEAVFIVQHIQSDKAKEENLRKASEIDGLSQLLNHISGERRVNSYLENGGFGMFCLMDVDKFKTINDTYGHAIGDMVISAVSQCMRDTFRDGDILMRLGGDEFGVFAPGLVDRSACTNRIDTLNKKLSAIKFETTELRVSVSIGTVIRDNTEEYREFEQLYRAADSLMYVQKKAKAASEQTMLDMELTDEMPGAMLVYSADEEERILFASRGLVELFDCDSNEQLMAFTEGTFKNIVHPKERERVYREIQEQLIESGEAQMDHVCYHIISAKGVIKNVEDYGHLTTSQRFGKAFFVTITEIAD